MKKIFRSITGAIILLTVLCLLPATGVHAASVSASFDIVSKNTEIAVEDMIKVELNLSADVEIGAIEAYISYDSNLLEYIAGPDCILGGEGVLRISDSGTDTYSSERTYLLYFSALSKGEAKLSIRDNPEIYDANESNLMSVSSQPLKFEIKSGTKVSDDATLASLKVGDATLTPSFDPAVKDYTVKVKSDVVKLAISAEPSDELASVRIEGNDSLEAGQNRITINVTAADGTENKYVLYAVKEEAARAEEQQQEDNTDEKTATGQDSQGSFEPVDTGEHRQAFYVEERDSQVVLIADTEYAVCGDAGQVTVPDGFVQTSVLISGYTLTAFMPESERVSEYLLLVLQKEGSEPGLYCYDRIEKTIQRYDIIKGASQAGETALTAQEAQELTDGYEKSLNNLTLVIAIVCAIAMALLIVVIRLIFKLRR